MHADLMHAVWPALSLDHDFHEEEKLGKLLFISLPSPFRGHPGLAKYPTVWVTFSRYFLLDAFSLACAIQIISAYGSVHMAAS